MKRSKNIFNSPIIPESLLDQQGHRQFLVGGLPVSSGWLQNVPQQKYQRFIISALRLSELDKDLGEEKGQAIKNSEQTKKANLFRIGNIKKKIDNFGLIEEEKEIILGEQDSLKNQPPSTENFRIHKISGGFFKSILQRKCKIDEKELYIQSHKEEKNPWIKLGIEKYTLQLESKEHPLNKQDFKEFLWPAQSTHRILLTGKQLKPLCIYGQQQQLKKMQRYFQVQSIQVKKQVGVFEKLDLQLRQKIITLFGNKVRFYDHSIKMRRAEKEMQYYSISKNSEMRDTQAKMETAFKPIKQLDSDKGQSSQFGMGSDFGKSGLLEIQFDNKKGDINKSNININSEIFLDGLKTPDKSRVQQNSDKKKSGSEIFKLRLKSSVIFYDQIEDPIHFDDQGSYSVTDLKLNLKQQVGISEVDQESENKSVISIKKQKIGKKVVHMSLKNAMDESQKFNINIHEASEQKNDSQPQKAQSQGSKSSHKKSPFSKYSLNLSQIGGNKPERKQSYSDSILDDFHLVRFDTYQNEQQRKAISPKTIKSVEEKKQNTLIREFKKKKVGEIQIHENLRPQGPYFAIQSIEMFVPYHKQTVNFEIMQIDPNLQIHHKIVVCARAKASFKQRVGQKQRYIFYQFQGGFHFRISKQSDQFIFMLKQQGKLHYIRFTVDPNPKYQRNCSQLLLGKLDQQGYPFACSLNMFASPSPVELKKSVSTIQFMHKYLLEGQNYQFKADFIDDKKRRFLVRREWNKEVVKNIVRNNDSEGFSKAVYLGLSDSIFKKIKNNLTYDSQRLFEFNENQLRLMQQNISSAGIMDLRAFMKTSILIRYILQSPKHQLFAQRLQHIYAYFLNRYGSTRNLALVFVKQVICKLESIIVLGKKEEQIQALIKLYFQLEYQIDEFFLEISKYFKK